MRRFTASPSSSASPHSAGRIRRAFTLIEILIVVAIIGIVAAILLPIFSSVRERTRTTTCTSNLRQIGLALQLYTNDYRGFYPHIGLSANPDCTLWADRIYPYLKAADVLHCPSYPAGDYRPGCPPTESFGGEEHRFDGSYDLNYPFGSFEYDVAARKRRMTMRARALHTVRVRRPSSTILVLDGDGYFVNPGSQEPTFVGTQGLIERGVDPRHRNGCNVCFA
ncbi:MAG: hypothetical protein JWN98_208, partial [Abditibacteriota bacterium]|nr:hypothetical protein [Abditibacteriota bacterium]